MFHDYILGKAEIRFIKGRVNFEIDGQKSKDPAPFPSMIVDSMVNVVKIYDENKKQVGEVKNGNWIDKYGIYQQIYTKEKGINAETAAKNMLSGVEKKVTLTFKICDTVRRRLYYFTRQQGGTMAGIGES